MISALDLTWVWMFLLSLSFQTSSGLFSLKVESPVSGLLGSSVSLHCAVTNNVDVQPLEVRWYRPEMYDTPALFYKDTQIQKSRVDVQYQGRVFLLGDLEKGDVSVKLENLIVADRGDYVCHVKSDTWYEKATVTLKLRVVGSTPVLSTHEAGERKLNVSCQSHGWLPEPSITWTHKDGRDLKHLSNNKFTNNSVGTVDVSSWLIVSPSEFEWISCSVGLSDQERKESRIKPHAHPSDSESWNVSFTVTLILLLLCIMGSAVCLVQQRKVVIDLRRRTTGATGNNRISHETSGTPSEKKHLDEDCVENDDRKETSGADTNHHTVDGDVKLQLASGAGKYDEGQMNKSLT
ncbi:butyrophilin-like protein 10 [Clarias gariepinus]